MKKFYIQIAPVVIENGFLQDHEYMLEEDLSLVLETLASEDLYFIIDESMFEDFSDLKTISESEKSYITNIYESQIDRYELYDGRINNVFYYVEKEEKLFENFSKFYKKVDGFIEFKTKDSSEMDLDVFKKELEKISKLLIEEEKNNSRLVVKNLNGWKIKQKFSSFGEDAYFISPDLKIYYHPLFYYNREEEICELEDFSSLSNHVTRSHLICLNCETFYCDRNIYYNKKKTSEYKVPSKSMCEITSVYAEISKNMFNELFNYNLEINHLDRISKFEPNDEYNNFFDKKNKCNKIKGNEFENRIVKVRNEV